MSHRRILAIACLSLAACDGQGGSAAISETTLFATINPASEFLDAAYLLARSTPEFASSRNVGTATNRVRPEVQNLMDTYAETNGRVFFDQLTLELGARACQSRPREELATLAQVLSISGPKLTAIQPAVDCLIESSGEEDRVLWMALNVWRHSGTAKSPSIKALAARAKDDRTRRRLLSIEDLKKLFAEQPSDR